MHVALNLMNVVCYKEDLSFIKLDNFIKGMSDTEKCTMGQSLNFKFQSKIHNNFLDTLQPHYNTPQNNAFFNIAWSWHGSQTDYFAICL